MLFVAGLMPGSAIGYALVRLPVGVGWLVFLAAYLAALGSYLLSLAIVSTSQATTIVHGLNIGLFGPPTFAATLLRVYWIRKGASPPHS
jgi:hypothetical protein